MIISLFRTFLLKASKHLARPGALDIYVFLHLALRRGPLLFDDRLYGFTEVGETGKS
jgi:hypothetical protein